AAATMLGRAEHAPLHADSVILMHDSLRYVTKHEGARHTAELLEPLIAMIRARGWEAGPLADALPPRPRHAGEEVLLPCHAG
ncbi:MAG: hypothetical protein KGJ43_02970, partial [Acidobacteriota bacterium]|nr:hypothetical protein [Acidobacteriota bacterium]